MLKKLILIFLLFITPLWAETEIYFSGQDNVQDKIIEKINGAKHTIDISIYSFTAPDILKALQNASNRGVKIRLIMDKLQSKGRYSLWNKIKENIGWQVKTMRGFNLGIMHQKLTCIDGIYLLGGSFNYTTGANYKNYENLTITDDIYCIDKFNKYYNFLWER